MSVAQPAGTPVANRAVAIILVVCGLFVLVVSLVLGFTSSALGLINEDSSGAWPYVLIGAFVAGDAIVPILPSESVLNTASVIASGESDLQLIWIIVAGSIGAIVGDSLLFWIARLDLVRLKPHVDKLKANPKAARALEVLGDRAEMLIVFGRYVPGLRFVVNAMYGYLGMPYRRFLLWSSIAGISWCAYTCILGYLVGSALNDFPIASIIISGAVTTAIIAVVYWLDFRRRKRGRAEAGAGA